eukprot:gene4324-5318_t
MAALWIRWAKPFSQSSGANPPEPHGLHVGVGQFHFMGTFVPGLDINWPVGTDPNNQFVRGDAAVYPRAQATQPQMPVMLEGDASARAPSGADGNASEAARGLQAEAMRLTGRSTLVYFRGTFEDIWAATPGDPQKGQRRAVPNLRRLVNELHANATGFDIHNHREDWRHDIYDSILTILRLRIARDDMNVSIGQLAGGLRDDAQMVPPKLKRAGSYFKSACDSLEPQLSGRCARVTVYLSPVKQEYAMFCANDRVNCFYISADMEYAICAVDGHLVEKAPAVRQQYGLCESMRVDLYCFSISKRPLSVVISQKPEVLLTSIQRLVFAHRGKKVRLPRPAELKKAWASLLVEEADLSAALVRGAGLATAEAKRRLPQKLLDFLWGPKPQRPVAVTAAEEHPPRRILRRSKGQPWRSPNSGTAFPATTSSAAIPAAAATFVFGASSCERVPSSLPLPSAKKLATREPVADVVMTKEVVSSVSRQNDRRGNAPGMALHSTSATEDEGDVRIIPEPIGSMIASAVAVPMLGDVVATQEEVAVCEPDLHLPECLASGTGAGSSAAAPSSPDTAALESRMLPADPGSPPAIKASVAGRLLPAPGPSLADKAPSAVRVLGCTESRLSPSPVARRSPLAPRTPSDGASCADFSSAHGMTPVGKVNLILAKIRERISPTRDTENTAPERQNVAAATEPASPMRMQFLEGDARCATPPARGAAPLPVQMAPAREVVSPPAPVTVHVTSVANPLFDGVITSPALAAPEILAPKRATPATLPPSSPIAIPPERATAEMMIQAGGITLSAAGTPPTPTQLASLGGQLSQACCDNLAVSPCRVEVSPDFLPEARRELWCTAEPSPPRHSPLPNDPVQGDLFSLRTQSDLLASPCRVVQWLTLAEEGDSRIPEVRSAERSGVSLGQAASCGDNESPAVAASCGDNESPAVAAPASLQADASRPPSEPMSAGSPAGSSTSSNRVMEMVAKFSGQKQQRAEHSSGDLTFMPTPMREPVPAALIAGAHDGSPGSSGGDGSTLSPCTTGTLSGLDAEMVADELNVQTAEGGQLSLKTLKNIFRMDGRDRLQRPIVLLDLSRGIPSMDEAVRVQAYLQHRLRPLVCRDYVCVMLFGESPPAQAGTRMVRWCMNVYHQLPRPFKKNVQLIVLVNPNSMAM